MNRTTIVALAIISILSLTTAAARADLTFDLRAVSGSQITIHGPKSVAVNQNSIGGWIDFELYAFVNGANSNANDESMHMFAANMLSTHIGRGAAGGSMVNSGEIAPRVPRGIVPPLDYLSSSDGTLQNLDGDPDLEIGGTGDRGSDGMIIGRGDPFRVRNYEGDGAMAEFLLYRFTLPVESVPALALTDMTSVVFARSTTPTAFLWFEDGAPRNAVRSTVAVNDGVLIHTAHTPEELAMIPEPSTWLLAPFALVGLALALRRTRRTLPSMNRTTAIPLALFSILALTAATARADLTFDLRAVSGSQITIHGPKSVAVNQNSVGGWIDFELYALVTGGNPIATDEGMVKFSGSMLSTHVGHGAAVGNMNNTGEVAPRARRGVLSPFDGLSYQDGTVQNLDSDPELEIGGTTTSSESGLIAARTGGNPYWYQGDGGVANIPLYRFTLPIESVSAQSLSDLTRVHFLANGNLLNFIWAEDGITYSASPNVTRPGRMSVNDAVLIHTAHTPEELAMIPEPGTWVLSLVGLLATTCFAIRRRN